MFVDGSLKLLLLLLTVAPAALQATPKLSGGRRPLLLVSLDGFRHDYLTKYADDTKFLQRMASSGVFVKSVVTEFATKTFPNHWSIVTGRHQESHGVVSNAMFDPLFNETFNMGTRSERWWNDSLPIWISAKRQGLKAATFFWPGSEVEFGGIRPDFYYVYNTSMTYEYRVETVVRWFTEEAVDLCTLYFHEPDSAGHTYGPDSAEVAAAIRRLDFLLQFLLDRLADKGWRDKVDIIITSDHGMSQLSSSRVVNFNNSLNQFVERYMDTGTLLSMFAKPGLKDQLVQFISAEIRAKSLPLRVFAKEALPLEYHHSSHRRIPDVLVLPDSGYLALPRAAGAVIKGNHGFDNTYSEMKVPLIAFGPSFQRGRVVEGFRQVDVYGLMCHLLRIEPQPNNGSLALLPDMLSSSAGGAAARSVIASALTAAAALLLRRDFSV